ncbi:hypothetical protein [Enterobacter cloacae]|uniref:hypothetical protein n=1 Tax=Enterobacter cloacae TaxID=550 RepID=UPI002A814FC2|nr:hypothetical protein [Enterobacter cloacae]
MSVKPTYEELERYGRQADITIENLELKLAESQREFRAADATIENMQMQVEKLAAENAGLKESVEHAAGCIQAAEAEGLIDALAEKDGEQLAGLIHRRLCHAYLPVETPATDAFLAEVRAQGAEMFAAYCGEENSVFVEAKAYYRSLPDAAYEFAAQLRQEAAQ